MYVDGNGCLCVLGEGMVKDRLEGRLIWCNRMEWRS